MIAAMKNTLVRSSRKTLESRIPGMQRHTRAEESDKEAISMTQEQKKVGTKLEEHLKPEELKKQKRLGNWTIPSWTESPAARV